ERVKGPQRAARAGRGHRPGVAQWPGGSRGQRPTTNVSRTESEAVKHKQAGSVIVGIIIGVVLGLAAALAVAVYVTKVPVPFLNKGQSRSPEQDAAETRKNRDWDPNAPLYGKNPAKGAGPAPQVIDPSKTPGAPPV